MFACTHTDATSEPQAHRIFYGPSFARIYAMMMRKFSFRSFPSTVAVIAGALAFRSKEQLNPPIQKGLQKRRFQDTYCAHS
jgi:hypothetical protein